MNYLHYLVTLSFLFICSFVYSKDNQDKSVEIFTVNGVSFNMIKV